MGGEGHKGRQLGWVSWAARVRLGRRGGPKAGGSTRRSHFLPAPLPPSASPSSCQTFSISLGVLLRSDPGGANGRAAASQRGLQTDPRRMKDGLSSSWCEVGWGDMVMRRRSRERGGDGREREKRRRKAKRPSSSSRLDGRPKGPMTRVRKCYAQVTQLLHREMEDPRTHGTSTS